MARLVLTDAYVVFAGVNISQYVKSIVLSTTLDIVETTSLDSTSRTRVAGLRDNKVELSFNQDYATSALEDLVYPSDALTKIGTAVAMEVRPTSAAVSATNPKFTFSALVVEWQSLSGSIGELAGIQTSWPITGAITKALS